MKKPVVILLHIGYWMMFMLLLLVFFGMVAPGLGGSQKPFDLAVAFRNWVDLMIGFAFVPALVGFYGSYIWLFDRFLKKKKILLFFVGILAIGLSGALAGDLVLSIRFGQPMLFSDGMGSALGISTMLFFITIVNAVIALVMKGFINWYGDIRIKEELARKNYETEILLIKAQLNPHFLFNTINNIDVLIMKDQEKASVYLNKLSDLLRFMLYETKTELIPLADDLAYIEKYIELQRLRTSNPDFVIFNVTGNADNRLIAPMLFIPFIENAFKYAENKKVVRAIEIDITIHAEHITFQCRNDFVDHEQRGPQQGGLGNSLIRRRLELLYPESHTLNIETMNNSYLVQLEIRS